MSAPRISAVVITRNEEADLPGCLASCAGFASETVVVDSGSEDGTCAVASSCGARVLHHPFESYSRQKQWACDQASGDWILILDADEKVDPGMGARIARAVLSRPDVQAWRIRRRTRYLGRLLRFGPWMGDAPVRLMKAGSVRFGDEAVHEKPDTGSRPPLLRGAWIEHRPYVSVSEHMRKMGTYARLWAAQEHGRGRKAGPASPIFRSGWRLFRALALQMAFLDGLPGITAALSSAVYAYWKWLLLWESTSSGASRPDRGVEGPGSAGGE